MKQLWNYREAPYICTFRDESIGICDANQYVTKDQLKRYHIEVGTPIYVVGKEILSLFGDKERKEVVKPFVKNSDIKKYWLPTRYDTFYLYLDSHTNISRYPNILKYLEKFRPVLRAREQVTDDEDKWYWIRGSKRKFLMNTGKHIICPYRCESNVFAFKYGAGRCCRSSRGLAIWWIPLYNDTSDAVSVDRQ